ncbi:hypothetical protein AYL99_11611 [Fonsecaea erecta]|uniref:DNA2/NAM7 helicase-like C-terminal domain-containing protein n=1 Tax=Fonsecaea erecta TaxID=1367422 RepID=A0A178Z2X5_9EURO|nr:hypothetical protein AYL99_11611 [Fonsecaea erecta]OAP54077.1 hypothetical protein AYL99_11611 [Fonsecaea erecta]
MSRYKPLREKRAGKKKGAAPGGESRGIQSMFAALCSKKRTQKSPASSQKGLLSTKSSPRRETSTIQQHGPGDKPQSEKPAWARSSAEEPSHSRYDYQFLDVADYQEASERERTPHFVQNLGEAEYAVALYQYMHLLGYPPNSISILATYAGQRALVRDLLEHRCKNNALVGMPKIVTTVNKNQGEQNDNAILSMTRTRTLGYLREIRGSTVTLSRARLGLYILGRKELFASCLVR